MRLSAWIMQFALPATIRASREADRDPDLGQSARNYPQSERFRKLGASCGLSVANC
jgi:hypothetical protein